MAKLQNSVPYKIKEIEFFPNSIYKFITCGIQHIAVWNLHGNYLSYSNLRIDKPDDLAEAELYKESLGMLPPKNINMKVTNSKS